MTAELAELRRHGFAVAYRMLGTVTDAEDVVQEALLRFAREEERPERPVAWITTVTTRLAIDHLRLARVRRETYVGPWLPEPLVHDRAPGPAARAELAESLSHAFLVVLEQLTPTERAAFLLHDVFDYDYAAIADVLARSEASCRQLVTRARRRLEAAGRPRFDTDESRKRELLERFVAAAEDGDVAALERMLAADATFYSDGGGKVPAARRPVHGTERIARLLARTARQRQAEGGYEVALATVNGQPGRIVRGPDGAVRDVLALGVANGRIVALWTVRNPDKLAHLARPGAA